MADRYDREYDRDRSLWRDREDDENRDWESEGGWARGRNQENWGEFGGSTRRGWGRNLDVERGPERWGGRGENWGQQQGQRGGRWYGSQQDEFGYGRGQPYSGGYAPSGRMGRRSERGFGQGREQWRGRGSQMGQGYQGPDYGRGGQGWEDPRYSRQNDNQRYGQQRYGQRYSEQDYGEQYGRGPQSQPWMDDDTDMDDYTTPVTYSYTEFWLVPGPFAGVGPDDYTRSPERLREDIIQRLTQHGQIDATKLKVEVNDNCEVTLTGQVNDRRIKRLAEDVAESVWGVNDVHNQIKVKGREAQMGDQTAKAGQTDGGQMGTPQTSTRTSTGTRGKS